MQVGWRKETEPGEVDVGEGMEPGREGDVEAVRTAALCCVIEELGEEILHIPVGKGTCLALATQLTFAVLPDSWHGKGVG